MMKASKLWNFKIFILLSLAFFCLDCSREHVDLRDQAAKKDNASAVDSVSLTVSPTGLLSLTYEQRQGRFLYTKYCSICHGTEGKGDGFNAFSLDPKPRNFTDEKYMNALSDPRLIETVTQGGRGVNRSPFMPSWGGRLNKREVEYVVAYIRAFAKS
jgi:mono/diheme cytochrome c family protein